MATLAITQPLLSALGENPTFFTAHSASPGQVVAFAAIVSLAPAAVLGALMLAVHAFSAGAGLRTFSASMTVLAFVFVLQVVDVMPGPAVAVAVVAAVLSYGLMILYWTLGPVRSTVSVLAVFPVAVVALFLFHSPVNSIVFPDDVQPVTLEELLGEAITAESLTAPSPAPASPSPASSSPSNPAPASSSPSNPAPASSSVAGTATTGSEPASPTTTGSDPITPRTAGSEPTSPTTVPDTAEKPASMAELLNDRFPPIYILVLDELPWVSLLDESGRIDAVRYPSFARLGATSHVFSNATTVAFNTELAVPALLTGTLQTQPAPVFSMYPDNLFTLLGGVYDVSSSDPLVDLCPPSVCNGSPPEEILELVAADEATRSGRKAPGPTTSTTADSPTTTAATAATANSAPTASTTTAATTANSAPTASTTKAATTANSAPTASTTKAATRTNSAPTTATTAAAATSSTADSPTTTTTASRALAASDTSASSRRGSLGLLLRDAAIVFGHLAVPEGATFGLPSIGATWGNFGQGPTAPAVTADDPELASATPQSAAPTTTSTARTASATTTTTTATVPTTEASPATPITVTATTEASPAAPITVTATTEASSAAPITVTATTEASSAAPVAVTATTEARPVAADAAATLPTAEAAAAPADADPVDPQRVAEQRTAFLDSLITSDTRVADFRAEVATMEASELPRLHYLHTLLPHVPWRFRPDGSTYADIDLPGYFSQWDDDPAKAHFGQQRHLLQLGLADRLLGEYLDRLEAIGDFDRATVIVAADHGISFVPGERSRGIGEANVGGIASVPLLYKEPGQRTGTVQHQPVQLIDVVPTIAARLGLDPPWTFDGRDMFAAGPATDRRVRGPFGAVDVPENLTAAVEALAADMHRVFGDGTTGSLYGLGGAHSLIGTQALDSATDPSQHCWILEQPTTTPDADGSTGYVYGRIDAPAGAGIAVALSINGVVAGTAPSYREGSLHRVYIIGDPQFWRADQPTVELHEIVGRRLALIGRC